MCLERAHHVDLTLSKPHTLCAKPSWCVCTMEADLVRLTPLFYGVQMK